MILFFPAAISAAIAADAVVFALGNSLLLKRDKTVGSIAEILGVTLASTFSRI